jgi:hypothetical protein
MEEIVNKVVTTAHLILLRQRAVVGAGIGMSAARMVVLAVVAVALPVLSEVEPRGRETMVAGVARQVAMTAQGVAAVKARSVAMVLEGLQVLVAQENQAV